MISLILHPKKLSLICNMLLFLQLEQKGHETDSFFSSTNKKQTDTSKNNSTLKDKDKEKHVPSIKKLQQDASRREAAAQKRMQDLIRQFGPILRRVAIFHLLFMFVGVCCGRGKYDICVHLYQSFNCLFFWICFFCLF
ncbi:putative transcription factor GTE1/GTE6 [Medicago truncatula]|uniref:Putative transcription factor GTE1/GTE6 n=1 Tax=Medicago truncatula TaxID=3880 RepID=A0A396HC77_MEDTR|nr:putative transcription factor GTE1/GTE6 [Medicago truncatula]